MMLAEQRWYSPHLKRWVSRDPIKYEGGVNLYGYVEQNPVGFVDPDGLEAISVGAAGGFAGVGSSLSSGAAAIGRFIAKSPVGLAVGAGVGAGLLVGDCIFEGPDGCAATLQGMCSSNSSVYPTPKTKKNDWSREDQRAREDCYKNSRTRAELERCLQLVQKNSKAPVIKKK